MRQVLLIPESLGFSHREYVKEGFKENVDPVLLLEAVGRYMDLVKERTLIQMMTKTQIKEVIAEAVADLKNGEYDVNDELTDRLVNAVRDESNEYGDAGVIVGRDDNGEVYAYIDVGSCIDTPMTVDEFADAYGV